MEWIKADKFFYILALFATYFLVFVPFVVAPLYFAFITSKYFYIIALTEIVIFSSLCLFLTKPPKLLRISPLMIFLGGYVFVTFFASIFGINPILSLFGKFDRSTSVILLLHLFFFAFFASIIFNKDLWQKFLILSVIVGASISTILIASYLGILDRYNIKSGVTFGNSSFLATYLLFVVFFSLYLLLETNLPKKLLIFEEKEIKFIGFLGFIISLSALILSTGRASTLATFSGLILILLMYFGFEAKEPTFAKIGKIFLDLAFIFIFFFLISFHWPDSFVQEIFYPLMTKARFVVWQGAFEAFKLRPFFGYGQETFELVYLKHINPILFLPEGGGEVRFDKAHNIIFETLVSSGIFGIIFYLSIFIYAFYFLLKNYFQKKISFGLMSCFLALLFAYFSQNLTVFDTPASCFLFFFVLGFLGSIDQKVEWMSLKIGFPKLVAILFIMIAFLFSFYFFLIKPVRATYLISYILQRDLSPSERMEKFKEVENSLFFGRFQARERYALKVREEYEKGEAKDKEMEFAENLLQKNIEEVEGDYYSMLFLGQLYNTWAKKDKTKLKLAEKILKRAIALSPKNLYAYWYLIETKKLEGDLKGAEDIAKLALAIQPKDTYSQQLIRQISEEMKKDKKNKGA